MGNPFSTPCDSLRNARFDQTYKRIVDTDVEIIKDLCKDECSSIDPVTEAEVASVFKQLNNNKAVYIMGLTSEHFKLAGQEITEYLACLLNYIFRSRSVSMVLKEGIPTHIFNRGDPSNYRGITVTPIYLKILEQIINIQHNEIFHETQSKLQKGFTPGCSSQYAAQILSECILEARKQSRSVSITLDTQKAFNVVDQNSLLQKLTGMVLAAVERPLF